MTLVPSCVARPAGALVALLAACVCRAPQPTAPPRRAPTAARETKDRVTASDETEAARRARVRMELAAAYFGRGQMTTALDQVKLALAGRPELRPRPTTCAA